MASKSYKRGVKVCSNHRTELDTRTRAPIAIYWHSHSKGTVKRDGDGWYIPHPVFKMTGEKKAELLAIAKAKEKRSATTTDTDSTKEVKGKSGKTTVQSSRTNARQANKVSRSTQRHACDR